MAALSSDLRRQLEAVIVSARAEAEVAAKAALEALAIHHHEPFSSMTPEERNLRTRLRAHARQLGDPRDSRKGTQAIDRLIAECAYEHWHRMLFARFLAENDLLIEPESGVSVSLEDCKELGREKGEDPWALASRFAQRMLPQIFRPENPVLQLALSREYQGRLESLLESIPSVSFRADDSLGWVYQFWQSKKKDEISRSEVKIGADEISAVTQLFTEPYMVDFLIHNTLGAWWAGKRLSPETFTNATTEEELRRKIALPSVTWDYLRFVRGDDGHGAVLSWRPASGTFDGWPKTASELKVLDPCCGSGHFLVAALRHLVPIRMVEEGLSDRESIDSVLRDNLHGLEIDERCCQIAAFALAVAAWTYPNAGGYRPLPDMHIACTGIGPQCSAEQWVKLAEGSDTPMPADRSEAIKNGILNLHQLFSQAPILGSLINPTELSANLIAAGYGTIRPYLAAILKAEKADDEIRERAIAAAGMVKATELLGGKYTLVITNVPYLGFRMQDDTLRAFVDQKYSNAKSDLAIVFVVRSIRFLSKAGTLAVVTPQNWLFLARSKKLREDMLAKRSWNLVARLGEHAFESPAAAGAFAAMLVLSEDHPTNQWVMSGVDVSAPRGQRPIYSAEKANLLRGSWGIRTDADGGTSNVNGYRHGSVLALPQAEQAQNPDSTIILSRSTSCARLGECASSLTGAHTLDVERFRMCMWEISDFAKWNLHLSTPRGGPPYTGYSFVSAVRSSGSPMHDLARRMKEEGYLGGWLSGNKAWGKFGVACSAMSNMPATLYNGAVFDNMASVIIPTTDDILPALWAFCSSPDFNNEVRKINQKLQVANATLEKVPFDLGHWQKEAAKKYPDGLPEPESDDPTQWLFHGRPEESASPLQVAVARLLGYRWPAELDDKMHLSKRARALIERSSELTEFAEYDGIVCLPPVRGESPAPERLRALIAQSFGSEWTPAKERELIFQSGSPAASLDDWLKDDYFIQHCTLFHHRPFVWHIWDGRKDGFHALINYHKLAEGDGKGRRLLESLTYSYLGDWISRQKSAVQSGEAGADARLAAAMELQEQLKIILDGEPPYDLFVRWKPLHQQPIGWNPDLNDGVRLNIRPFITATLSKGKAGAGLLRAKPNIKWEKDRGKEPNRLKEEYPWLWDGGTFTGDRLNNCHYSNAEKQAAREKRAGAPA